MWKIVAIVLAFIGVLGLIGTEVLRTFLDRRRRRRDGIGGTRDVAIVGILLSAAILIAAAISAILAFLTA